LLGDQLGREREIKVAEREVAWCGRPIKRQGGGRHGLGPGREGAGEIAKKRRIVPRRFSATSAAARLYGVLSAKIHCTSWRVSASLMATWLGGMARPLTLPFQWLA